MPEDPLTILAMGCRETQVLAMWFTEDLPKDYRASAAFYGRSGHQASTYARLTPIPANR